MANETLEQLGNALEAAQQKIGAVAEEVSEQAYNELVAIRREKLRGLQEAGNDPFELTSYPQADFAAEVKESFVDVPEGEQGRSVCMAGRMMSKRVMGKASFADLRDTTGNIQLYVRRDDVGVEEYQAFKKFDIGDIIRQRLCVPYEDGRDQRACHRDRTAEQEPAASARKIPRPEGPRGAVPPALCGPDRQPGGAQDV